MFTCLVLMIYLLNYKIHYTYKYHAIFFKNKRVNPTLCHIPANNDMAVQILYYIYSVVQDNYYRKKKDAYLRIQM